jgi:hypothetical protein
MAFTPSSGTTDKSLATAFLLILLFATPMVALWSHENSAWYLPYLLWLGIVFLLNRVHSRKHKRNKNS